MGLVIYRCPRCRFEVQVAGADAVLPGAVLPLCGWCRGAPVRMTRVFDCNGYRLWAVTSWQ